MLKLRTNRDTCICTELNALFVVKTYSDFNTVASVSKTEDSGKKIMPVLFKAFFETRDIIYFKANCASQCY